MKHRLVPSARYFFATAPLPCPYLPGLTERRLVTELSGRHANALHDVLSRAGFRRSHGLAYVPVCRDCTACAAVRVRALEFTPSRNQRRTLARNVDVISTQVPPVATEEQYEVFRLYQKERHGDGEMARMNFYDYQSLIEDTPVDTLLIEYRDRGNRLLGACLTDRMMDGYSAVYSYFDPAEDRRSLGTWAILDLVDRARARTLPYVYLGFWIASCQKMAYKSRFQPLEAYTPEGWVALDPDDPETTRHFRAPV